MNADIDLYLMNEKGHSIQKHFQLMCSVVCFEREWDVCMCRVGWWIHPLSSKLQRVGVCRIWTELSALCMLSCEEQSQLHSLLCSSVFISAFEELIYHWMLHSIWWVLTPTLCKAEKIVLSLYWLFKMKWQKLEMHDLELLLDSFRMEWFFIEFALYYIELVERLV